MNKIFYYFNNIYDWFIDKHLHVKTTKSIKLDEHDNIINFMYEPLPYRQLKNVFSKYRLSKNDHFMDFGCGKGRVLVMAAKYGCKNLYGLDINNYLIEIAEKNLIQCKYKYNDIIFHFFCMNAKNYNFNPNINKIFFNNPFQLKVFIYVFKALLHSIDKNPRIITVYFYGAKKSVIDYFEQIGRFQLVKSEEKNGIYIYVHNPN